MTVTSLGPAVEERAAAAERAIAALRGHARELATTLPMPSHLHDEDWRRTDISKLDVEAFTDTSAGGDAESRAVAALRAQRDGAAPGAALAIETPDAVILDGTDLLVAQGVTVSTLADAVVRHPALVERGLSTYPAGENRFAAMWHARWRNGLFVHVPTNVRCAVPVWAGHTAVAGAAVTPATVIVLDEGAELELVEVFASAAGTGAAFSNAATLAHVAANAGLRYSTVQLWGEGVWHIARHRVTLDRDARLSMFAATFGARLQKAYWDVILAGEGADATINALCFGDGTQHLDHQSLQRHLAPGCRSDLLLKSAVRDRAQSVYSGLIDVAEGAQKTDGYVQNRNLVLSQGARASSVPRLEIRANDVRCSHGTTSGHVDAEERFYLMARGVPAGDADRIIVRGFMEDVLARAPHEGVRALVAGLLDEELATGTVTGVTAAAPASAPERAGDPPRYITGEAVPAAPETA